MIANPGQRTRRACSRAGLQSPTTCSTVHRFHLTYTTYMPNKTISVPDDVVPIIESLDVPFSRWVTEQLRRHAAVSTMSFGEQLLADAALAGSERPTRRAAAERMERSSPW